MSFSKQKAYSPTVFASKLSARLRLGIPARAIRNSVPRQLEHLVGTVDSTRSTTAGMWRQFALAAWEGGASANSSAAKNSNGGSSAAPPPPATDESLPDLNADEIFLQLLSPLVMSCIPPLAIMDTPSDGSYVYYKRYTCVLHMFPARQLVTPRDFDDTFLRGDRDTSSSSPSSSLNFVDNSERARNAICRMLSGLRSCNGAYRRSSVRARGSITPIRGAANCTIGCCAKACGESKDFACTSPPISIDDAGCAARAASTTLRQKVTDNICLALLSTRRFIPLSKTRPDPQPPKNTSHPRGVWIVAPSVLSSAVAPNCIKRVTVRGSPCPPSINSRATNGRCNLFSRDAGGSRARMDSGDQTEPLGDLDVANARPQGQDITSVMGSLIKSGRAEVTHKLRREGNKVVQGYVDQSVTEFHMLDIECFTYHNALLESPMAPTVILATNHSKSLMRGTTDIASPQGIPVDFLDWCMIVQTEASTCEQVGKVVQLRANVEGLRLGPGVLDRLAAEGEKSSLRYALQLLTPASILAGLAGRASIEAEDIGEMGELFLDAKTSAGMIGEGGGFFGGGGGR
ncbi:TIP49 C-terminus-domain-containing protein [Mycena galericulata]|nr:TIP49 C-terminus-domain-containing protein [Mycena galericulata]